MKNSASHSIIFRLVSNNQQAEGLPRILAVINKLGAEVKDINLIQNDNDTTIRDITINTSSEDHILQLRESISELEGVKIQHMTDRTFLLHQGGKIEIQGKIAINSRDELSMAYTPGVARVCMAIHHHPEKAFELTIRKNMVAIVSDGTAVLGLGDIGPLAALPVMEGKAMLLKAFANVDAFPICLDTKDPDEIIRTVKLIAPNFGGINLEDIAAPRCFEIEDRLKAELDIPVFHDDQHGTAAVMTAALINSLKIVGKKLNQIKVVFNGVGAAGTACTNMLLRLGVTNIIGCDRGGALTLDRYDLNSYKRQYAEKTNPNQEAGNLYDVMQGADVFVGVSTSNILTIEDIKKMNKDPIIFALANPDPEINPEIALPHVAILATGRSDYPNQINNLLAFPGIFRGALDCQARQINLDMQIAAAYAIANAVPENELARNNIVPCVFNSTVVERVAAAVIKSAKETGVIRKQKQEAAAELV